MKNIKTSISNILSKPLYSVLAGEHDDFLN